MKLLIDMNLSPRWIEALTDSGIEARHWSTVGDGAASDRLGNDTGQSAAPAYGGDRDGSCCSPEPRPLPGSPPSPQADTLNWGPRPPQSEFGPRGSRAAERLGPDRSPCAGIQGLPGRRDRERGGVRIAGIRGRREDRTVDDGRDRPQDQSRRGRMGRGTGAALVRTE